MQKILLLHYKHQSHNICLLFFFFFCLLFSRAPPVTLLPEARYDQVMSAFGGRGFLVRTPEELRKALEISLSDCEKPSLLNILIDPSSDRKQQVINIRASQLYV